MSFEFAGFPLSGVDHLCPDEQEQVAVVLAENGEQYEELPPGAIYACKDDLVEFNQMIAEYGLSKRFLSEMFRLIRHRVLEYKRVKADGTGEDPRSYGRFIITRVARINALPILFDERGEFFDVRALALCLESGLAMGDRRILGLGEKSHKFLTDYVNWRLSQEEIAIEA